MIQQTLGEIIKRFEQRGLKIVALKLTKANKDLAERHYTEDITKRRGKPVRDRLLDFIQSSPIVAMVIEGVDAIENVRKLCGVTESRLAIPGTIRGDYSHASFKHVDNKKEAIQNLVHASSSEEEAKTEIAVWFSKNEIYNYKRTDEDHVF